jgi:hypothetical protein
VIDFTRCILSFSIRAWLSFSFSFLFFFLYVAVVARGILCEFEVNGNIQC